MAEQLKDQPEPEPAVTKELSVTDFRMAGYLVHRGHKLKSTRRNFKGEVVFVFDNSARKANRTLTLYSGSPEEKYDKACKTMHTFTRTREYERRNDSRCPP